MTDISLPDTGFLSGASENLKHVLGRQAKPITLAAAEVLFEQGDPGDALFAITEGALEISVISLNGRKLSLDLMGPGAIFGEIALFDPGPRTATVTAPYRHACCACATPTCCTPCAGSPNWAPT